MSRKSDAIDLMKRVMNGESYLTYKEIAKITGYHEKYLLKLKKDIYRILLGNALLKKELEEGTISLVHGNTNRKPKNTITEEEKQYIISLYKRSNASIRKFCKFYKKRSYSCIWHVLKEADLI